MMGVVMMTILLLPGVGDGDGAGQGSCHAIRHRIHCCLAVYQQSITLLVAVMAILHALVALGRRKANGSSSKEIHQAAAD
jgi:hypothetical protein